MCAPPADPRWKHASAARLPTLIAAWVELAAGGSKGGARRLQNLKLAYQPVLCAGARQRLQGLPEHGQRDENQGQAQDRAEPRAGDGRRGVRRLSPLHIPGGEGRPCERPPASPSAGIAAHCQNPATTQRRGELTRGAACAREQVICIDNFFTGSKENIAHLLGKTNFELIRHDVVEKILLEVDQIFHLACPASPIHYKCAARLARRKPALFCTVSEAARQRRYNPIKTIKTSFLGTMNMLGLAKRTRARFLLTSTSEVRAPAPAAAGCKRACVDTARAARARATQLPPAALPGSSLRRRYTGTRWSTRRRSRTGAM